MLEVSSPPSRAVPPKTGLSSLQREQALSVSQEMRSSAKRAGGPLHASSVGRGLGPAPCLALPPGPHQLAASSGASLQRFGGGIQAGLPPALGTFKEAKLPQCQDQQGQQQEAPQCAAQDDPDGDL